MVLNYNTIVILENQIAKNIDNARETKVSQGYMQEWKRKWDHHPGTDEKSEAPYLGCSLITQ